ncbi:Gfo/Idh/MocA family oxidoreductase [Roseibium sp. CAU 1637]|uniref:Gfo/Idh/MocA family oxidoreductase n=1 Tax=Roseibium limicola TaxID=2816037 RepID=A0A939JAW0_9HYPH|nr:Gfo/Idh/MocA family oxidoreductase [Roseibium limicola]MBO0347364.1 Gfo/Idh/MocA family oxidoreductase [Roseibium limicola]
MTAQKIAIVGLGKIAKDQHLPSISRHDGFDLAAIASRSASGLDVPTYEDLETLLKSEADITAIALCVPPQVRYDLARLALEHKKDVLLEKPPGATLAEVHDLIRLADENGCVLYATWHSRHAMGVAGAKAWLAGRTPTSGRITWREDVKHWHPGQKWIWEAGGVGVFDPGINALSILTEIMPVDLHITAAELTFPENCDTPIAADIDFQGPKGFAMKADFDWRQTGKQTWEIEVETTDGTILLRDGGATVLIDGKEVSSDEALASEYDGIYAHFADLLASRTSDVDLSPLVHVADAFMLGKRVTTEAFYDEQ